VKDEGSRFGLPAFKILGASWATTQAIAKRLKLEPSEKTDGERPSMYYSHLRMKGLKSANTLRF